MSFAPTDVKPELAARYQAAMHAMQTGVMMDQEVLGSKDGSPKQLRVGVNSSMIETSALTRLLLSKGIIADFNEWFEILCQVAEEEVQRYERRLSQATGTSVKLA